MVNIFIVQYLYRPSILKIDDRYYAFGYVGLTYVGLNCWACDDMTQQNLASKVGVRRGTIVFLEKVKFNPRCAWVRTSPRRWIPPSMSCCCSSIDTEHFMKGRGPSEGY